MSFSQQRVSAKNTFPASDASGYSPQVASKTSRRYLLLNGRIWSWCGSQQRVAFACFQASTVSIWFIQMWDQLDSLTFAYRSDGDSRCACSGSTRSFVNTAAFARRMGLISISRISWKSAQQHPSSSLSKRSGVCRHNWLWLDGWWTLPNELSIRDSAGPAPPFTDINYMFATRAKRFVFD